MKSLELAKKFAANQTPELYLCVSEEVFSKHGVEHGVAGALVYLLFSPYWKRNQIGIRMCEYAKIHFCSTDLLPLVRAAGGQKNITSQPPPRNGLPSRLELLCCEPLRPRVCCTVAAGELHGNANLRRAAVCVCVCVCACVCVFHFGVTQEYLKLGILSYMYEQ